jgi:hypothetical protein
MSHTSPLDVAHLPPAALWPGRDRLRQEGLPGHQGRRHERVVARVGARLRHRARQVVAVDVEGVGVREGRAQRLGERLGLRRPAQSRLTAAAPARIRMIPP